MSARSAIFGVFVSFATSSRSERALVISFVERGFVLVLYKRLMTDMPVTKESLRKQAADCRTRVNILLNLKQDIVACVENTCQRILNEIEKIEGAVDAAQSTDIKKMVVTLRTARNMVREYEDALERIRMLHEDDDLDLSATSARLNQLLASVRTQAENGGANLSENASVTGGSVDQHFLLFDSAPVISSVSGNCPAGVTTATTTPSLIQLMENASTNLLQTTVDTETVLVETTTRATNVQTVQTAQTPTAMETARLAVIPASGPPTTIESRDDNAEENATAGGETIAEQADSMTDCRLRLVSKGNGNIDDCCQSSVELISGRVAPIECVLSHSEHPSLFYIHLLTSNVEEIEDELTRALETEKKALPSPKIGDYCAAPIEDDPEMMRRAKILEIKNNSLGTSFAKILYIDTGKVEWIATKALLEMPRRVRHFLRQACPCVLADVEPTGGVWDESSIATFRELCQTDESTGLFVKALDQGESPTINTVALYRMKNGDRSKIETVSISLIRATEGKIRRADRQVPMIPFEKENGEPIGGRDPPDVTDGWRCVVRVLEDEPIDETEETADLMAAASTQMLERVIPPRPMIVQGALSTKPLSSAVDEDGMIYFHVTEVVSPGEFYIQLRDPYGRNESLDRMTIELNSFYSNPSNHMLLTAQPPLQAAAVRYPVDGKTAFRRIMTKDWHTPTSNDSKDIRVTSSVTAIFVDDGFCRRLGTGDMFVLDERFCALSAQAALCKLYECYPTSFGGKWDRNSIDIFRSLTMQGKPLLKAIVTTEKQPFELIVIRIEQDGTETYISSELADAGCARSSIEL